MRLLGADELIHHAEHKLGIKAGSTTPDGLFTLEHAECQAACTEAPCLQVNYRYRYRVTPADLDTAHRRSPRRPARGEVPPHGTVARVRQHIPSERAVGAFAPDDVDRGAGVDAAHRPRRRSDGTPIPRAGFVAGDRPQIVTRDSSTTMRHTLERYLATDGYKGLQAALAKSPVDVHDDVKSATCSVAAAPVSRRASSGGSRRRPCGRGTSWSTATRATRHLQGPPADGARSASAHRGLPIACYAAGLSQCFLYIRGEMALAQERVATALNEAYAAGYIGKNILGSNFSVDIVLHWGAGAYVVGEETALIESLEGNRGMPRLKPPYFPAAIGLYGKPTIVNNVETLANLPWLMLNGVEAYTAIGTPTSPGTRMVAVSGHVKRPGVYEIINGTTTFRDLLYGDEFCGGIRDENQLKAFVPGGGSAPWFLPDQLDLPFEGKLVGAAGSMLGSGAIDGDGRHHRHRPAAALTLVPFLRPRIVRQVRAVPRGWHMAGTHHEAHRRRSRHPRDLDQLFEIGADDLPRRFPHAASERSVSRPSRSRSG